MMARHELTWAEYIPSVLASGCPLPALAQGSNYPSDLMKMADDYPIGWLAPDDFDCYLGWLSKKTGHIYRLPTGAEWEFAARAGATTRFAWGHDPGFNNAAINTWFDPRAISKKATFAFDPREQTGKGRSYFPVESFPPNAWGLYDVIGNVSEYTAETKPGDAVCIHNAGAEKCTVRAVRGGSTSSIGLRLERDGSTHLVGEDINPFEDVAWYMGGFANLPGFRIV
jgi:formylglycine-generating enzyme required for sulfatase activity